MTPKQKAAYLIVKYMSKVVNMQVAKECALVAVDEILNQDKGAFDLGEIHYHFEYWMEVKQEIEKA
jgi:hypothetical protein